MKMLIVAILLSGAISASSAISAGGATVKELVEQLNIELKREAQTGNHELGQVAAMLGRADGWGDDQWDQALASLDQIDFSEANPRIRQLVAQLRIQVKKERENHKQKLKAELGPTIHKALETGFAAKTAADLDEPISTLSKLFKHHDEQSSDREIRQLFQQGRTAADLLQEIQNVLAGVGPSNGETPSARIAGLSYRVNELSDVAPRSQLLAGLNSLRQRLAAAGAADKASAPGTGGLNAANDPQTEQDASIGERLRSIKTLAEIAPTLKEVEAAIARHPAARPRFTEQISTLSSYARYYHELQQGYAVSLQANGFDPRSPFGRGDLDFAHLRTELILLALPRVLGATAEQQPHEGELPPAYLLRMKKDAIAHGNWPMVERVAEAAERLSVPAIGSSNDALAVKSYLGARNLDQAEQYKQAVSAYQAALKTGSQDLPLQEISDRLQTIRQEHPSEYEAGSAITYSDVRASGFSGSSTALPAGVFPPGRYPPGMVPPIAVPAAPAGSVPQRSGATSRSAP